VTDIVMPWAVGVREGAQAAVRVMGGKQEQLAGGAIESYANRLGLLELMGIFPGVGVRWYIENKVWAVCYSLLRFLNRDVRTISDPLKLVIRIVDYAAERLLSHRFIQQFSGGEKNIFKNLIGYAQEGKSQPRKDFHKTVAPSHRGQISTITSILDFDTLIAYMDEREEQSVGFLTDGYFSRQEQDDFKGRLRVRQNNAEIKIDDIGTAFQRMGVRTEQGFGIPEVLADAGDIRYRNENGEIVKLFDMSQTNEVTAFTAHVSSDGSLSGDCFLASA